MLVIRAGTYKMLVRIANSEDADQTASSESVCSGTTLFVWAFGVGKLVLSFSVSI